MTCGDNGWMTGHPETARSGANMNTVSANTQVGKLMFAKVPFEEACAAKFCCALPSPRTSFVDPQYCAPTLEEWLNAAVLKFAR